MLFVTYEREPGDGCDCVWEIFYEAAKNRGFFAVLRHVHGFSIQKREDWGPPYPQSVFLPEEYRDVDGHSALLVEQEERLHRGLEPRTERDCVLVIPAHGTVDDELAPVADDVAMQVAQECEVGLDCLVPLGDSPIEIGVGAVHTAVADGVAVHESDCVPVDLQIGQESFLDDPVELGVTRPHVVVHVVFERVPDARAVVLTSRDASVIAVRTHDGDALEVAMLLEVQQTPFDDALRDDRLADGSVYLRRLKRVHVQSTVDEVAAEKQDELRDGTVLPFLLRQSYDALEEPRRTHLCDGNTVRVETVDRLCFGAAAYVPVSCHGKSRGLCSAAPDILLDDHAALRGLQLRGRS